MHSSDRGWKKYLYRVIGLAIIIAVVLCAEYAARWSFDAVRNADYYNYDIKKLKAENADVGMIVVGASQVYHACNPDIISGELGIVEVIDCATASGQCDGTYYMLRDLLRNFTPKYVVMELPWLKFLKKTDRSVERGSLLAADCLPMMDKLDYAIHCFRPYMYMNLLSLYRFGGQVWGTSQLIDNYRARKAVVEGNWVDESERTYRKNGFCWYTRTPKQGTLDTKPDNVFSEELLDERERSYMLKMYEMCREKGIQVIWVTLPSSLSEIYGVQNYQASIDYSTAFAKETGCPYLNFSYWKGREETFPDSVFSDRQHLNGEGSVIFSKIFCDVLKMTMNGEDTSSLFYQNLDEMKKDVHRIVAATAVAVRNGDGTVTVHMGSFQNDDVIPEYRLLLTRKKRFAVKLANWQEDTTFTFQESELPAKAKLRLEVRQKGKKKVDAYIKNIIIGDPIPAQEET